MCWGRRSGTPHGPVGVPRPSTDAAGHKWLAEFEQPGSDNAEHSDNPPQPGRHTNLCAGSPPPPPHPSARVKPFGASRHSPPLSVAASRARTNPANAVRSRRPPAEVIVAPAGPMRDVVELPDLHRFVIGGGGLPQKPFASARRVHGFPSTRFNFPAPASGEEGLFCPLSHRQAASPGRV